MYSVKTINEISPVWNEELPQAAFSVSSDAADPDAILVRSASLHDMPVGSSLKCIARAGAGYNNIPVEELAAKGVVVFNTPGANANAVKELAVAALLLGSRRICEGVEWCKTLTDADKTVAEQVEKGKARFAGPEIYGKTLGVVGLGAVGLQVANTGVALGMNVLGYDPFISVDNAWKLSRSVTHTLTLDEILEKSDYISIHVPLIDSTRGMFNTAAFEKMKKRPVLINLSRGALVVDDDVIAALENGLITRYVTDFPDSRLNRVPNVIPMPHLGASTPESEDNCVRMASRQIRNYILYGSIENSVNFPNLILPRQDCTRICVLHKNVPNVINTITNYISALGINISNMANKSRGIHAYTVIDLESGPALDLLNDLRGMDTVYNVRILDI